jgi:hypothetical protein
MLVQPMPIGAKTIYLSAFIKYSKTRKEILEDFWNTVKTNLKKD